MRSALIKLSKKILVGSDISNEHLRRLFDMVASEIDHWKRIRPFGEWQQVPDLFRQNVNKSASEYGESILKQFLKNKLPEMENTTTAEKNLIFEKAAVEILRFVNDLSTLEFYYCLYSEPLTLIDSIQDSLILAKGDHQTELLNGTTIHHLFSLCLSDGYEICEYKPIVNDSSR